MISYPVNVYVIIITSDTTYFMVITNNIHFFIAIFSGISKSRNCLRTSIKIQRSRAGKYYTNITRCEIELGYT